MFENYSFAKEYRDRKKAIIPQDKESNIFLYDVDAQTKIMIEEMFGIIINYDWHCNTIAEVTIESIIKALNTDMKENGVKNVKFNFYDLFGIKVTTKINEDAEKEGNINIAFEPGLTAIRLIKEPDFKLFEKGKKEDVAKFFAIEIPAMDPDYLKAINQRYADIDQHARYNLNNNWALAVKNPFMAFAVTYVFIFNLYCKLLRELGAHPELNMVSVNFNDLIEFHCSQVDDDYKEKYPDIMVLLTMRPGLTAKLLIKSDETTEDDEIDEDNFWMR